MRFSLGFSSCPNDTFIFDALVNCKIDTEGLEFDVIYADIEQLNSWAIQSKLDVTKLSYHAYTYCKDHYIILDSGSALGKNCGPLLITRKDVKFHNTSKIAIPGKYTTANMLLDIAYPDYQNKVEVIFSNIENQLLEKEVDAGLIIHENRFTYQDKGLVKIQDLGQFWEQKTSSLIPLGGIVVKRNISDDMQRKIQRVLKRSIIYAMNNREDSFEYIKLHAQETDRHIIDAHINLYVNDFTISLSNEGRKSIEKMFHLIGKSNSDIFLER